MDEQARYEKARKRVEDIKGFYSHLLVYVLVNLFLILINFTASRYHLWFWWPLLGWGIGLVAHGVSVFGIPGILGSDWEQRKIRQIMEKEERKQGPPR